MKKHVIIPIAIIAAIIAVSVLAIILYKPVIYQKHVYLGGDKLTVEIRERNPFTSAYTDNREYNLRVTRAGKVLVYDDFRYADKVPINAEFVTITTETEGNANITISRGYGNVILKAEIRGDSARVIRSAEIGNHNDTHQEFPRH